MKLLLTLLISLALASSAHAWGVVNSQVVSGESPACNYDYCERFEYGSNTSGGDSDQEEVWTDGSGVDFTYTTLSLEGDQSAYLTEDDEATLDFTNADDVDIYFEFQYNGTLLDGRDIFYVTDSVGTRLAMFKMYSTNTMMRVYYDGGYTQHYTILAVDTHFYVKLHLEMGTGANGVMQMWINTDGNFGGAAQLNVSNTEQDAQASELRIDVRYSGITVVYDNIFVDITP